MYSTYYRFFTVGFGMLPITIVVPRNYSKQVTRAFLVKRLREHTESLISRGIWECTGQEEIEVQLTVDELMETY